MPKKLDLEEFIDKANIVHNNKYNYSKVDYKNSHTKICIICPEHGEFWQESNSHLQGNGCHKCGVIKNHLIFVKSNDLFIKESKKIHLDKYDYSKVNYVNNRTKLCIICPIHGEFWKSPSKHLQGQGCPKCSKPIFDINSFINKAKLVHNNFYTYEKSKYVNNKIKICITCPIHGDFNQNIHHHLQGQGCPKCRYIKSSKNNRLSKSDFVKRSIEIHGDKYDYSKSNYIGLYKPIRIICHIHGEFWQIANNHIIGEGCPICGRKSTIISNKLTIDKFIDKANIAHNNKYDYNKTDYINCNTKVCIICPNHGEFYQLPNNHLFGQGCPICNESKLEKEVAKLLDENNITYERQKRFKWLGRQSLDFYLPLHQIGIECQGRQHFSDGGWCNNEDLKMIKVRDERKFKLCVENNINLLYYSNLGIDYPYEVIENKEELITKIK